MNRPAVCITGAAKRIGAVAARAFAAAGWHVVIHYGSSAHAAETLAQELPSAQTVHCDLADTDAAAAMIGRLADQLDDWRCLVNCAAIFRDDSVTALDRTVFDRSMAINARTPARMAQAFLMQARTASGRRVIQVTDQKIANPNPDFFSYTMSKHALAATVPMLAAAASDAADRVYGLAPGAILASHDQDVAETETSHVMNLLQRKTGADEIADAMLFLSAGHLATGQTMYVDSGQHLLDQPRDVIFLAREQMADGHAS
ncbi:MAG: SDR family oxidoreductase [Pontixanthobacter sp.]